MLRNPFDNSKPVPPNLVRPACIDCHTKMQQLLDGELKPSDRVDLELHLAGCKECKREFVELRRSEAALTAARNSLISPGDLRPEFYARLAQQNRRHSKIFPVARLGAIAAVATFLVVSMPYIRHIAGSRLNSNSAHGDLAITVSSEKLVRSPRLSTSANHHSQGPMGKGSAVPIANADHERPGKSLGKNSIARFKPWRSHHYTEFALMRRYSLRAAGHRSQFAPGIATTSLESLQKTAAKEQHTSISGQVLALKQSASAIVAPRADRGPNTFVAVAYRETELHISDENRNFMASIDYDGARLDVSEFGSNSDNSMNADAVELPPMP